MLNRFPRLSYPDEYMHYKEVLNIVKKLKIPIIDISEIYTKNGFEKVANELVITMLKVMSS